jgi:hypothetical protein
MHCFMHFDAEIAAARQHCDDMPIAVLAVRVVRV